MNNNPESDEFWNHRYRNRRMAWDYGSTPPDLLDFLERTPGQMSKVLIPGCGSGYEIVVFREAGYLVDAIELSEAAITHAKTTIDNDSHCIRHGDFFTADFPPGHFDIIYERTFHCALPPHRHIDYVERMHSLIRPGGLLLGLFLYGHESEPPPYPMDPSLRETAFQPHFSLKTSRPSQNPIPMHKNMEYWQIWQRKG